MTFSVFITRDVLGTVAIAMLLFLHHSHAHGQDDTLYSTSFEELSPERITTKQIGEFAVAANGTVTISGKFASTGKQCLHMAGDANNSIEFQLPDHLRAFRGVSFRAERWTSRNPFAFRVEIQQNGIWKEIAVLDSIIQVGARFLSHIKLAIPDEGSTTAIRFYATAASEAGVLLDDLVLHKNPPQRPTSLSPVKLPTRKLKLETSQSLFISGTNDTHTFRIPALVTTPHGTLIAACDARRKSGADVVHQRTIDIVYRRSEDNGMTWSPIEVIDPIDHGGCSDPSLLVDEVTGDVFCFYNYMSLDRSSKEYRFYVQKSSDDGKTWGNPNDITDQIAGPELENAFKFITSGRGIQTRSGQLIHNYVRVGHGVTLFGSSDHGTTWKPVGDANPGDESKVVQLHDGTLMVNSRIAPGKRYVHRSSDGGKTWESEADFGLPDPRCNAAIIQYTAKRDGYSKDRLVFCNAASNTGRENLAVRISYDGGVSWSEGGVIDRGPSAYSEISILRDGSFAVLYEPGHAEVRFVRFTLKSLTDGEDFLSKPWASPKVVRSAQN